MQILYVYSRDSTFVTIDRELLARRATVTNWPQPRPWVNVFALARQVRGSDLVVGWFASWHTFWPVLLARLFGRPSVLVVGGYDSARLPEIDYGLQQRAVLGRVSRWVMRSATRLVANSEYSRREIEVNAGIPPQSVRVIHHGVPDPFGALPAAGSRERLALTVGIVDRRNLERKGLMTFVRAAALAPDIEFVVAGKWADDAAEALRAAAGPNVSLTGWLEEDELEALYLRASVYVQASRHEGFGLSVAEAMLAGCFPVVSSAGALPEVVGDTGVVLGAAAPAPDVVADAVRRGITVNGDVREHARQRVLEHFTLDARGEQLWQVLDEAMGN